MTDKDPTFSDTAPTDPQSEPDREESAHDESQTKKDLGKTKDRISDPTERLQQTRDFTDSPIEKQNQTVEYSDAKGEQEARLETDSEFAAKRTVRLKGKTAPPKETSVPKSLGRYQVMRVIGEGGFGSVFVGFDPDLNREVAIKVPRIGTSETNIDDFISEARSLAQLRHTGIVTVHDVGVQEDTCFIVSSYLKGVTLRDWMKKNKPDWQQAIQIVAALADALAHAHSQRIVHRDLKPSNVILTDDMQPVLVDFGLAISDAVDSATQRGAITGTPYYMSPEQVRGKAHRIDGRTDIFSLGVILYQLLCGRLPFRAKNDEELRTQIREDDPQPLRQLRPDLPQELERICLKALAKKQSDRYTTAADLARELRAVTGETLPFRPSDERSAVAPPDSPEMLAPDSSRHLQTPSEVRRAREAERRQVTLLYCGYELDRDDENGDLDPEEEHDAAIAFRKVCEKVMERFDGAIIPTAGQEQLICFGYPVGYEDAVRRAVYSGLEILEKISELNSARQIQRKAPLQVWAVAHTGKVVVGEELDRSAGETISMTGEARNVATKMEHCSEPGAIVISQATQRLVEGYFDCESLGQQRIKGVSRPLEIFKVTGKSQARSAIEVAAATGLTPMVGRDREVDLLKDRWEEAEEVIAQVVLLIGEAGLGKSRLVYAIKEHVAKEQSEQAVIEWRCSPYYQNSALNPVVEYLERAVEIGREDEPQSKLDKLAGYLSRFNIGGPKEIVPLFASLLSIPLNGRFAALNLSPQRVKERTLNALIDLLREHTVRQPVLFVVEDLHWIDPSTLEFLSLLVAECANDRILSVFTFRPEFAPPWGSLANQTQVALNRLRKKQVAEMIQLKTGLKSIESNIVEQIAERTGGVPLFVEEFAKVVQESGGIKEFEGEMKLTDSFTLKVIPATLQDLLMARLDRMDADRDVIQIGAALGREFTFELINAVSPLEENVLREELAKLARAEVVMQRGRPPQSHYQFKHALIQDAAYQSLLKKKRRQFHNTIATVLEKDFADTAETKPELLAHHYTEAGEFAKGVGYWLKAGQRAQLSSANTEAINHLQQGLEVLSNLEESNERDQLELGLQATLGPVLMAARGWGAPEIEITLERTRELCEKLGAVNDQFFVMWGQWGLRLLRLELDVCREVWKDIQRFIDGSSHKAEWMTEAHWIPGCTSYYEGDFSTALDHLKKGITLYNDEFARANALKTGQNCGVMYRSYVALSLWKLGFPDQALQHAEDMIQFARELDHPFSLAMAIYHRRRLQRYLGLQSEVQQSVEEECKICHEQGFAFFEASAIFAQGDLLVQQGKFEEGSEKLNLALLMFQPTGCKLTLTHPFGFVAATYLKAGKLDECRVWLDRAFELVDNHNERFCEAELLRLRGELALAAGNESDAEDWFEKSIAVAVRQKAKSWELRGVMSTARLNNQQGRSEEARKMLSETCGWFTEGFETADLVEAKALLDDL